MESASMQWLEHFVGDGILNLISLAVIVQAIVNRPIAHNGVPRAGVCVMTFCIFVY